jgi:hypothetical protein
VVRERNQARVTEAVELLGAGPAPRELLSTILGTLLPLREETRADGQVALAFLAYSAVRPTASAALREETQQLVGLIASLLPVPDSGKAARGLLALTEGLGVYLLGGQYTPDEARAALDAQLDLIFNGRAGYDRLVR